MQINLRRARAASFKAAPASSLRLKFRHRIYGVSRRGTIFNEVGCTRGDYNYISRQIQYCVLSVDSDDSTKQIVLHIFIEPFDLLLRIIHAVEFG
jgi:hypothetical protein